MELDFPYFAHQWQHVHIMAGNELRNDIWELKVANCLMEEWHSLVHSLFQFHACISLTPSLRYCFQFRVFDQPLLQVWPEALECRVMMELVTPHSVFTYSEYQVVIACIRKHFHEHSCSNYWTILEGHLRYNLQKVKLLLNWFSLFPDGVSDIVLARPKVDSNLMLLVILGVFYDLKRRIIFLHFICLHCSEIRLEYWFSFSFDFVN